MLVACTPGTGAAAPTPASDNVVPATVALSPTAVARATAPPLPTVTSVAHACDHPYFPVQADARWTYRTSGSAPEEMVESRTPIRADGFVSRTELAGASVEQEWQCSGDGLVAMQLSRLAMPQSQLRFVSTSVTGVTLPAVSAWNLGAAWSTVYQVEGGPVAGSGNPAQGRISVASTIVAEESVTVPAGTYTALKLNHRTMLELSVTVRDFVAPMNLTFETTSWHARGVGLVKQVGGGEMGETTVELTRYQK